MGLPPTAVVPTTLPAIVDPTKIMNPKELAKPPIVSVIAKPVNMVTQPTFIPNPMPPATNVRTRIAPVNSALVSSMRPRDPRLARHPVQAIPPAHPVVPIPTMNDHFPSKLPPSSK